MRPWLNWIERLATDQKVAGSSPAGRMFLFIFVKLLREVG